MPGVNPYIQKALAVKATRAFKVTFVDEATGKTTEIAVDPATFPFGHIGLEGSVLDIADGAGIHLNHSCGGVCACSTCHVHVQKGGKSCPPATEDEEDELDKVHRSLHRFAARLPVRAKREPRFARTDPEVEPESGARGTLSVWCLVLQHGTYTLFAINTKHQTPNTKHRIQLAGICAPTEYDQHTFQH